MHACPSHGQKRAARNAVVALAGVVSPQSHVQASSNSACAVIRRMPLTKKDVYAIVKKHELDGSRRGLLLNVVCALDNEDLELMGEEGSEEAIMASLRARLPGVFVCSGHERAGHRRSSRGAEVRRGRGTGAVQGAGAAAGAQR